MSNIKFIPLPEHDHTTKIFLVLSVHDETILGKIKWYTPWHKIVFWPEEATFWSSECLHDVQTFIDRLTNRSERP